MEGPIGELGSDLVLLLLKFMEDKVVGLVTWGLGTSKQDEKLSHMDPMIFLPFLKLGREAKGFKKQD